MWSTLLNTPFCLRYISSPLAYQKKSTQPPPRSPVILLSLSLSTGWTGHKTKMLLSSFPLFLSITTPPPCFPSHTISCYLPPRSLLALNDTVYTHPASIIPFHTSPGLFICLGCWGDMKARSLPPSLSLIPPLCLLSFSSAGCSWPLIYKGLLSPGGTV